MLWYSSNRKIWKYALTTKSSKVLQQMCWITVYPKAALILLYNMISLLFHTSVASTRCIHRTRFAAIGICIDRCLPYGCKFFLHWSLPCLFRSFSPALKVPNQGLSWDPVVTCNFFFLFESHVLYPILDHSSWFKMTLG